MKILPKIFTPQWCEKTYKKMTAFLENGGIGLIFAMAVVGILLAVVGHYGTVGFNWGWFVFFELPLYAFCVWALWQAWKMWVDYKKEVAKRITSNEEKSLPK